MTAQREIRTLSVKRSILLSLFFGYCLMVFCACYKDKPQTATREMEKKTISFWNGFTGPDGQTMWEIVKQFEQDFPQYQVKMEIIPWSTYFDKLMVSLGSGKPPDVFVLHENELLNYVRQDAIRPLDDLVNGDNALPVSDFLESIWQRVTIDETIYGIPLDCHDVSVFYNKDYFEQLGVSPPEKLDRTNFISLSQQLTVDEDGDGHPEKWGFVFGGSIGKHFYTLTEQFGGQFLNRETGRCLIDQPPAQQSLQFLYDAINVHRIMPNPIHDGSNLWQGFLRGRIAMYTDGIWMMNGLKEHASFDWGVLPYPQVGNREAVWASSHVLCLPKYSDTIDWEAAWTLLTYLSNHGVTWSDGGQLPARYSQLNSPEFVQREHYPVFASQIPQIIFGPNDPNIIEIQTRLDPCLLAAMSGQQPMQKMVDEIRVAVESILRRSLD